VYNLCSPEKCATIECGPKRSEARNDVSPPDVEHRNATLSPYLTGVPAAEPCIDTTVKALRSVGDADGVAVTEALCAAQVVHDGVVGSDE